MKMKTGAASTRILIVDDHPVLRRGLSEVLADTPQFEVCGHAADKQQALGEIERLRPDIVIMDISLPDGNGLDLIKELRRAAPEIKVLALSMHDEALFAERAVRAGAFGYVNKNEPTEVLIEALNAVRKGQIHLSNEATIRLLQSPLAAGAEESAISQLSDRELQVFELIGEGLITKQVAARLQLSVKTIETYRENIKAKLGLQNSTELTREAVRWVLERG